MDDVKQTFFKFLIFKLVFERFFYFLVGKMFNSTIVQRRINWECCNNAEYNADAEPALLEFIHSY